MISLNGTDFFKDILPVSLGSGDRIISQTGSFAIANNRPIILST
jgi:hypothetical protein